MVILKKLVKITAILLSKKDSAILKLKNEYYVVLVPKDLVVKAGFNSTTFDFELISDDGRLALMMDLSSTIRDRGDSVT